MWIAFEAVDRFLTIVKLLLAGLHAKTGKWGAVMIVLYIVKLPYSIV